jgi:urate oxidase
MAITLGTNRYGKAENRVVRVTRNGPEHSIIDLNVSVQLSGDFEDTHITGDNSKVLPTDTQKNTVYAFAQKHPEMEPEAFALLLGEHFLDTQEHVSQAEIRFEQYLWHRIICNGTPHPRAFRREGSFVRTGRVVVTRERAYVVSGIEELVVLKTSDSEFTGYIRDQYTTLQETTDRIMATSVTARWRHTDQNLQSLKKRDFGSSYATATDALTRVFAEHYSLSLQQTLYAMGQEVLKDDGLCEIRLTLPNKHHFLVDMSAFGQKNENEVFHADDRPYGLIEAVVSKDDAPDAGPVWPNW